jgi:hypothetical protein
MVERGTNVMEAVTDDHRQAWIERLRSWQLQCEVLPLGINFVGGRDVVSVYFRKNSSFDSRVEVKEMVLRSV